jgi:leucyl-tRNA synthetase
VKFGKGNPLETEEKFVNVKCPKCRGKARRETDTMDTFFDSSWYYLRYCDNKNKKKPFDLKKADYWMPVDQYIGGAEHATMHLIYARFFTKALRDLGFLKFDEPFLRLFNQGMLHGSDGFVMSKSRGNDVLPEKVSEKYSIDTARLFLVSIASTDKDIQWSDEGVEGSMRFINKVMDFFSRKKFGKTDARTENKLNKTIKEVTSYIENFQYNLAVIAIRELFNYLENGTDRKTTETFLKLLSPFCPHISEELWHRLGNKTFLSLQKWPVADEKKINPEFEKEEKAVDEIVNDINNVTRIVKEKGKSVNKIYLYVLPQELEIYTNSLKVIEKRTSLDAKIYSVSDKGKHDPENKSKKVKPGKPGIYLE